MTYKKQMSKRRQNHKSVTSILMMYLYDFTTKSFMENNARFFDKNKGKNVDVKCV